MGLLHNSLFIALLSAVGFVVAHLTYGRFLAHKVLGLDAARMTPAYEKTDGVDFVPTRPSVLFGHHFASIAGLGPIVGPAIAIAWGWSPALLWVFFGSVFLGAVHDLATLYASLRHQGRGLGDLTVEVIGPRARILFLIIIFFLLALAMGVFALYMAQLFVDLCPQAVAPTFSLIGIAVVIGLLSYKLKWRLAPVTVLGLVLMFAALLLGLRVPAPLYKAFVSSETLAAIQRIDDSALIDGSGNKGLNPAAVKAHFDGLAATDASAAMSAADVGDARIKALDGWTYLLLVYAFIASVLPVWLLLQPRDYINSYQLYLGLVVILLGFFVWRPVIGVPAFQSTASASDPLMPFLFITIACGAISGFHSLVSSGTTVRQIQSEKHALGIGYGAMLTEGFLAVLVILACVAGLSDDDFGRFYGGAKVNGLGAFLSGAGVIISKPLLVLRGLLGISEAGIVTFCTSFIAVVVISFAMTTLDSATRLLRFNVEELGKSLRIAPLANRYVASAIAIAAIGFFAFTKIGGKPAGMTLWQLFGTTNQLLASLGLLVVSVMLYKMNKPIIYTVVPMLIMIASVGWAMVYKLDEFYRGWRDQNDTGSMFLFIVGTALLVLSVWLMVEAVLAFRRYQINRVASGAAVPLA